MMVKLSWSCCVLLNCGLRSAAAFVNDFYCRLRSYAASSQALSALHPLIVVYVAPIDEPHRPLRQNHGLAHLRVQLQWLRLTPKDWFAQQWSG